METFFMQNSEIQEWVDLLIEKLFTVCLLGNSNADSEFYIGRQTVEKIAGTLQKVTDLSDDTLKDGIKQLIEQRLPDPRVMENFPQFYNLMEELILSGISLAHQNEVSPIKVNTDNNTGLSNSRIPLKQSSEHGDNSFPIIIPESNLEDEDRSLVTVFAPIATTFQDQADTSYESNGSEAESAVVLTSLEPLNDTIEPSLNIIEPDSEAVYQPLAPANQTPAGEERLLMLLKQIYPEDQPHLNVVIGGYPIFAQVLELLIYIHPKTESAIDEQNVIEANLNKLGYHVAILQKQDLAYPRRMERSIRQALRKETKTKSSTSFLR
ncbi:hypothetical protein ACHOLT_13760 [Desulfitobacterium sp. Sab5]|uniref:hypothetical protein n=1 Tax=Desulfitobacterium nosdiversum TaxID=3375356 RepID=UPI003CEB1F03